MSTPRTVQQLFDLTGKTALITGGSRGLGLQMAHALGEAGAKVVISSRKAADLEQAVMALQDAGIEPGNGSPQQFSDFINAEMVKWAKVAKGANIQPE